MKLCLITDDAPVIRKVASHILGELGFMTVQAATGAETIRICEQEAPNYVLLDWMIDDMDALEVVRKLRSMPLQIVPKIIIMTTAKDPVYVSKAFTAGATDLLIKPFDRLSVQEKMRELRDAA
ncbi:MAG: response regulator [Pseudomonadota bacterium]